MDTLTPKELEALDDLKRMYATYSSEDIHLLLDEDLNLDDLENAYTMKVIREHVSFMGITLTDVSVC
jgi:hypothetical protein